MSGVRLWGVVTWVAWAWALLLGQPGLALAQQPAYDNFLVGDRSLGLSGAFVGLADDASAAYHNPAGLAPLQGGSLSTSLWAAAVEYETLDGGYQTDLGHSNLDDLDVIGLPFFIAGTVKFGDRDERGIRRHALGFTLVSPHSGSLEYSGQQEGISAATGLDAATRHQSKLDEGSQWAGLSYSYMLDPRWSFGLTVFGTMRQLALHEVNTRVEAGPLLDQTPGSTGSVDLVATATAWNLLFRVGAMFEVNRRWRLGLMLQPPGPGLGGSVDYDLLTTRIVPEEQATDFTAITDGHASLVSHMPWEVRGGATYFHDDFTRLTFDASVIGAGRLYNDAAVSLGRSVGRPVPEDAFVDGVTMRAAVGGEYSPFLDIPFRSGLLFEMSPTSGDSVGGEELGLPYLVGGSLSVGILGEGYGIAVGTTVTHERSRLGLVQTDPVDGTARFSPRESKQTTIYLFISGGSRAASKVADTLEGMVRKPEPDADGSEAEPAEPAVEPEPVPGQATPAAASARAAPEGSESAEGSPEGSPEGSESAEGSPEGSESAERSESSEAPPPPEASKPQSGPGSQGSESPGPQ